MFIDYEVFRLRADALLARIEEACRAAGRKPRSVTLLPVTKTHPAAAVEYVATSVEPAGGRAPVLDRYERAPASRTP